MATSQKFRAPSRRRGEKKKTSRAAARAPDAKRWNASRPDYQHTQSEPLCVVEMPETKSRFGGHGLGGDADLRVFDGYEAARIARVGPPSAHGGIVLSTGLR
jgi:hypothetical protein